MDTRAKILVAFSIFLIYLEVYDVDGSMMFGSGLVVE